MNQARQWFAVVMLLIPAYFAQAEVIEMNLSVPTPALWQDGEGFVHVEISGYNNVGDAGTPSLPGKALQILIPLGHEVVSVDVWPAEPIELPGSHMVYPVQRPLPILPGQVQSFTPPDAFVYDNPAAFPLRIDTVSPTQFMRGFGMQPVIIKPVIYLPQAGTLWYHPWVRVTVNTTLRQQSLPTLAAYRGFPRDFKQVASVVDNPLTLSAYPEAIRPLAGGEARYVVITNQAMANCSGGENLQALIANKESRGISAVIKTVEAIRGEYSGRDDAEKIRNYIIDMYANNGTDFVLLAGDADLMVTSPATDTQAPVVPVRGMYVDTTFDQQVDDNIPSDLYYACLDGDFNADGDAYWGEPDDNPDLQSEVWVGRAAVDSCTEVNNFVRKTLNYQAETGSYLRKVVQVGEWLWESEPSFGKDYLYHVENSSDHDGITTKGFSESSFFTVSGLYDKDQSGTNCDGQSSPCWSAADIMAVLNGGNHIINHLGHSYTYYNMRLQPVDLVYDMNNTDYFFEYSQGCYPGAFDNRGAPNGGSYDVYEIDSFAEYMTLGTNGAFAVVMNTRFGWGGVSNLYHRTFWDGVFGAGITRLGELQAHSRHQMSGWAVANPYYMWVYYETMLFGDPELSLHVSSSSDSPLIGLSQTDIWTAALEGGDDPRPEIITIQNLGGGTMNWSASSNQSWLQVTPASGTAPNDITLSFDATGLALGEYQATLTISAPGAANSPLLETVSMYVISVPSSVAPLITGAAPTLDGVWSAGEYDEAEGWVMTGATEDGEIWLMHDGAKLYMVIDIPSDTDDDVGDDLTIYIDNNANDLWPTTAGNEGVYVAFATGETYFAPMSNDGSGAVAPDLVAEPGFIAVAGFSSGHRVFELSFDLTTSHLLLNDGDTFSVFVFGEDYTGDNDQTHSWDTVTIWPYYIDSLEHTQFFGDVTLGTAAEGLTANPDALYFSGSEGTEVTDWQSVTVSSTTSVSQSFTVTAPAWLKLSDSQGDTPSVLRFWADPTGLAIGTQTGTVQISVPSGPSTSIYVEFEIGSQPPAFAASPSGLFFNALKGDSLPPGQSFQISNIGGGSLNWTATKVGTWFDISPASGSGSGVITVTPNTSDIPAGFHTGAVLLTAPGAEPMQVALSYSITVPPILSVNPSQIVRSDPTATDIVEVELQVINANFGSMAWTISETASWLSLDPESGSAVSGSPGRITVSMDPSGLSEGTHETDIVVTAPGASNSPTTVHVAWTLSDTAVPVLSVTPSSLSFQGTVGGSDPAAQQISVSNAGDGDLNWSVSCADAWLSCTPASGAAPGTISVVPTISGLTAGAHNASAVITCAEAYNSPITVPVTLTLTGEGENQAPPAPSLVSPRHQSTVDMDSPELTINNVTEPDGDKVTYTFEVAEKGASIPSITLQNIIAGVGGKTYTNLNATLADGMTYQWRARAVDEHGLAGPWSDTWEFTIELGGGGGGGCSTSGQSTTSGSLLLLLLTGLVCLRRRR